MGRHARRGGLAAQGVPPGVRRVDPPLPAERRPPPSLPIPYFGGDFSAADRLGLSWGAVIVGD